ncbi:PQQ-binding-like beta-propeller repeat protein [Muriicola sp. Z0-33]|uniref:outer membrane protein assembly factor BamB family protein n=1 Tax=Muriicola sp. Z0-33 TaxID=2816957 RepID=UPI002237D26B|nr:PQQ-binding-like beta-propeller repeat protein [Muriicola sp. Z0-33]MCW5516641.1 PQQ-binding-like beta-propeller repeat protein [Muriicola sp. Z0-33]
MKYHKPELLLILLLAFCITGCRESTHSQQLAKAQTNFSTKCAMCHYGKGAATAPSVTHMNAMSPRSIVAALESGKMQIQGSSLSKEEKIGIAEMLTSKKYSEGTAPVNMCDAPDLQLSNIKYSGWAGNVEGTGYIASEVAQLSLEEVPKLKLIWAFGFDGGTISRSKPAVIDNSIVFGSQFGEIYCLNMQTGCVQWIFRADSNVRGGIAVSQDETGEVSLYFADFNCTTYALKANTGELLWKASVRNESANAVTGTVAYFDGMVYVPLTSMEVVSGNEQSYECCKGSGMVVAVDAENGEEVWRHRVVEEKATAQELSSAGTMKYGPSGAPVWSSPTIDAKRGLLYIGTGENNSFPTTDSSDALQALDLKTGELVWNYQATTGDAYVIGTFSADGTSMEPCANCPDPTGPDLDFGMAPVLTQRQDGKEVLIVGQKSGVVHCLDPDSGIPIWQKRIGRGGALGGIHWGIATRDNIAYVSNSDWFPFGGDETYPASPGLYAMDLMNGEIIWKSVADPGICNGIQGCYSGNSAAPTLIDEVVFAGNLDGHARAHNARTGEVIWDFDTLRDFETVNGVAASGGSIDGPGPVIANGMVFFNSGYGMHSQKAGNVFLAFGLE